MNIRSILKPIALGLSLPLLMLADLSPNAPTGLTFTREAAAIIGRPFTPMSYAGVARRTTRRVVAVEATATTSAVAAQEAATAQQQQAVAQQQAATAQQQAAVAARQAGAAVGTVVPVLPSGCSPMQKGGVEYYRCGDAYYRSAFQGNNLVYVVVQQP